MQRRMLAVAALTLLSCRASAREAAGPSPPPEAVARVARLDVVARGLKQPVALTYAPGDASGRLFIVEKVGRVRILAGGRLAEAPFLDLTGRVSTGSEQGLLGLAFHPRYAENGRLFVNYTDEKGDTRVVEYRVAKATPDAVLPASARELLKIEQPYSNHNGGDLVFGPDGKLYIGTGDGGAARDPQGNGQNPKALLGKMLRLDVDAAAPAPDIVALGLRNPWRYSFDRKTGDLWIADVGQDRWEEVDLVPAGKLGGQNFGWGVVEGMGHCMNEGVKSGCDAGRFTPPIYEYKHPDGCSITGGFVYRGAALPALDGLYFFADYCTGMLRSLRWKDGHVEEWNWKPALDPKSRLATLSSFGEDAAGELFVLSLDGIVYKFVRS